VPFNSGVVVRVAANHDEVGEKDQIEIRIRERTSE
jgi:hypothetical protein